MPVRTWCALLRGINVGNSRRIAMVELRDLVAGFGYGNVRTLLNSGNVLFDASPADARDAATRIRAAIEARFAVGPRVFVRSVDALAAIIAGNPLPHSHEDAAKLVIAIYDGKVARTRLDELARRDWQPERFAVTPEAAYLWCPDGLSGGPLADAVFHALGEHGTTRNLATLSKIVALGAD
jgi:uncharacterized protein (DUF1697 family)